MAIKKLIQDTAAVGLQQSFVDDTGGGGVTVDNQSDPPAEVSTIVAAGADTSVPGTATLGPAQAIFVVATGPDTAEVNIEAQAEDGNSVIQLDAYSENGTGTVQVSASSDTGTGAITLLVGGGPTLSLSSAGGYIWLTATQLGFFDANPANQPAAIADATDPASTMARLNDVLAALRVLGLIDT